MDSADILNANCNLFKKMRDLAEKQEELIAEGQMDEFNSLLNQREHLQKEIMANARKYDAETRNIVHERRDQKAMRITMEISEIIKSIQETDKKIEGLITSKKDIFLNDIENIKKGQKAVSRYGGGRRKVNKFLDRRG